MQGALYFGFLLIALSAVLLAQHWTQARSVPGGALQERDHAYVRRQLGRRSVASALIGLMGVAMTMVDQVPRRPVPLTMYLCTMLLGGSVIFAIALADIRAARKHREVEQLELLAKAVREAPRQSHSKV